MQKLELTQEVLAHLTDPKSSTDIVNTTVPQICPTCSAPPNAR